MPFWSSTSYIDFTIPITFFTNSMRLIPNLILIKSREVPWIIYDGYSTPAFPPFRTPCSTPVQTCRVPIVETSFFSENRCDFLDVFLSNIPWYFLDAEESTFWLTWYHILSCILCTVQKCKLTVAQVPLSLFLSRYYSITFNNKKVKVKVYWILMDHKRVTEGPLGLEGNLSTIGVVATLFQCFEQSSQKISGPMTLTS